MLIGALLPLWLAIFPSVSRAALADCLSEAEFRSIAAEIAPKVNLFSEAWKQDPAAEFYGGTTRDYLYWLKGKFRQCGSKEQAAEIISELKKQPAIDVREFIIGDSDVDIVSAGKLELEPRRFGVAKFDTIGPEIFDPQSERGKNELVQGYIPAEKVRLRKSGIVAPAAFGDGVGEIYSGRLTVHFTDPKVFAQGHYAKEGINHPILMALRYLRLLGINYYRSHGPGYPDLKTLMDMDPASRKAVEKVIAGALGEKRELSPYLQHHKFRQWLNSTIQKSFRSYTNPTAAHELLKAFRVDKLPAIYQEVEPLNQYLFAKHRDLSIVEENLRKIGTSPEKLYVSPGKAFSDGHLYHGTRTEGAFRGILLQGVLPSIGGSADAGLYGVNVEHKQFSESWGGKKEFLLRFPVKGDAKIVDITQGEGERVWKKMHRPNLDEFAEKLGIDIINYPYSTQAFVVKNSAALGRGEGVYRKVMLLSDLRKVAAEARSPEEIRAFLDSLKLNNFTQEENRIGLSALPKGWQKEIYGGPIASEEDFTRLMMDLIHLGRTDPVSFGESLPFVREAVKNFPPAQISLESFIDSHPADPDYPFQDALRARLAAETILQAEPAEQALEFLKGHMYRLAFDSIWSKFLSEPWVKESSDLLARLLGKFPESMLIVNKLIEEKNFSPMLANPKLNEIFWQGWRNDLSFLKQVHWAHRDMMQSLESSNPAAYDRAMEILLSEDPKTWIERVPPGPRGNAESRQTIRALYYAIMPYDKDSRFYRQPRAQLWLKEFMDATLTGLESDTASMAAILLKHPNVLRQPDATRWMNALVADSIPLSSEVDAGFVSGFSPFLKEEVTGLLDQEPWRSHPLRDIWLESLKLPRFQYKSLKSRLVSHPRKTYVQVKSKLVRGLPKKIEAWQASIQDTKIVLAATGARPVLDMEKNKACRSFFQRLLVEKGR